MENIVFSMSSAINRPCLIRKKILTKHLQRARASLRLITPARNIMMFHFFIPGAKHVVFAKHSVPKELSQKMKREDPKSLIPIAVPAVCFVKSIVLILP